MHISVSNSCLMLRTNTKLSVVQPAVGTSANMKIRVTICILATVE